LGVAPAVESVGEDVVGWIAALVLVGLMLPLLGMLYLDILEAKHEVKAQVQKVEKLRRELEQKEREK
jgi:cell division protein FtsB